MTLLSAFSTFKKLVKNPKEEISLYSYHEDLIEQFQKLILQLKSEEKLIKEQLLLKNKEEKETHRNEDLKNAGIIENALNEMSEQADTLETNMRTEKFENEVASSDSTIETVVKVGGKEDLALESSNNSTALPAFDKPASLLMYLFLN
jgi:hypothetical protein